ncbi:MAG: fused DSP-PTPase phosphatase/NAD kinase-like protein [Planctomycetota bacterium]|jgi:protein tyrosine/serine phosphatase
MMSEKGSEKTGELIIDKKIMSKRYRIVGAIAAVVFIGSLMLLFSAKVDSFSANVQRDLQEDKLPEKKWAEKIELAGLPNFHKVSEDLYRGAQPTEEGFGELKKLGIKTIVNLRSFHSDRDEMAGRDFIYEHIYMKAWHPEDKEIILFLDIVTDESKLPVFAHCLHGADRTGTMSAVYRIFIQGWSKEEAIEEMVKGGYGFHSVWQNLIKYIEKLDIDNIRLALLLEKSNRWLSESKISSE